MPLKSAVATPHNAAPATCQEAKHQHAAHLTSDEKNRPRQLCVDTTTSEHRATAPADYAHHAPDSHSDAVHQTSHTPTAEKSAGTPRAREPARARTSRARTTCSGIRWSSRGCAKRASGSSAQRASASRRCSGVCAGSVSARVSAASHACGVPSWCDLQRAVAHLIIHITGPVTLRIGRRGRVVCHTHVFCQPQCSVRML